MSAPDPHRTVVITGCSTGIGRATAIRLDRDGYRVFAGVRKPADGERLQSECSDRLMPVLIDVTNADQIAAAADTVRTALGSDGQLSCLINNAGICEAGPIECISLDRLRKQLEINLVGQVAVLQGFFPLLRAARGRVITVSSAAARSPLPLFGAYAASKAGISALMDSFRRESAPAGVSVVLVEPGTVETAIWDKTAASPEDEAEAQHPSQADYADMAKDVRKLMLKGRTVASTAESVAQVVCQAVKAKRPKTRYLCGPGAKMSGVTRLVPDRLTDWVIGMVLAERLPSRFIGW